MSALVAYDPPILVVSRALLPALLLALAPVAARAGAVSCGCYCGKVISPPCSDAACKQACGWREPGGSARRGGGGPAYDAEAARRAEEARLRAEEARLRAEEEQARREADELARKREAEARRRAREFEDARDRTAAMLHGANGLGAAPAEQPSPKSDPARAGAPARPRRTSPGALAAAAAERRAVRCVLAPLMELLREHGPAALQLGADLERELDAALRAPRKALASSEDEVVRVFRDLQRASPGAEVQAVADALVVRSGATGEFHLQVQFSVGRIGLEPSEGQSVVHLDRAGRLKDGELTNALRACVEK